MITSVQIYNNVITARNVKILKNTVTVKTAGTKYGIMSADGSANIKIGSNTVNAKGTGILMRRTRKSSVYSNKITRANAKNQYGILISNTPTNTSCLI